MSTSWQGQQETCRRRELGLELFRLRKGFFLSSGGWGEGKRKSSGERWEGKRALFPSSPRTCYFSIINIFLGISSGNLCGGESDCKYSFKHSSCTIHVARILALPFPSFSAISNCNKETKRKGAARITTPHYDECVLISNKNPCELFLQHPCFV